MHKSIIIALAAATAIGAAAHTLSNGVELPAEWPPRLPLGFDPMPLPYLAEMRPAVIPIDSGRQLLVDSFLIERSTLRRVAHQPRKVAANPLLRPETPLEMGDYGTPGASAKDGGVWWDPAEGIFKMWYEAGWLNKMAYATSRDGLHWERPELDVVPGTNEIVPDIVADASTVWLDHFTDDPSQRFKMFLRSPNGIPGRKERFNYGNCMVSPDGIHWSSPARTGRCGDRSTVFYNPFRRVWVYSLRNAGNVNHSAIGRYRLYHESPDFMAGAAWDYDSLRFWTGADYLDDPDPYIGDRPQLYNLSATPYESIMVALPQIHLGPDNAVCRAKGVPKITELKVAYSRDGFHWDRTDRDVFICAERHPGAWDRGYVQSVGGICAVVGDELWFYYIGFSGDDARRSNVYERNGMHYGGSTGMAVMRRDGFVSHRADSTGGELLTRPVRFSGSHLFVNVALAPEGTLAAEMVGDDGKPLPGFSAADCRVLRGVDSTIARIGWKGRRDLSELAGRPVRLRFRLTDGDLYAFWVSPSEHGESLGYNAAGGPGFSGGIDREGERAYRVARPYQLSDTNH
ncbi:MAG: glycosyl hydrolase family 32 [Bacteroides sp.]|nr:glycosyl hydrolase family 32 [Bacteroides sp.]